MLLHAVHGFCTRTHTHTHPYIHFRWVLNLNICAAVIVNEAHCGSIEIYVNEHTENGENYEMKWKSGNDDDNSGIGGGGVGNSGGSDYCECAIVKQIQHINLPISFVNIFFENP